MPKLIAPVSKPATPNSLLVHYEMWDQDKRRLAFTVVHKGEIYRFKRLGECRDFAEQNGYDGIRVTNNKGELATS